MENPIVTICIPVYNTEKYIEKCCRSLFEQTYENIEYVFVDDSSPDNSIRLMENVLQEYPSRKEKVKIIKHNSNKGLAATRNSGIDAASGEYLMFVDSDDYLDHNTVELLINKAETTHADIVIFDTCRIYPNKKRIIKRPVPDTKEEAIRRILTYKLAPSVCGKLYKTQLIAGNNIRFIEGINIGEDYCTSSRIFYYADKIAYCPDCVYNYVQYNTNSYTHTYQSKNITDMIKAISVLDEFFQKKKDYSKYKDCLNEAKLLVKSKLIIDICTHRDSVWDYLPEVSQLYTNIQADYKKIALKYRIIIWLAEKKHFNILSFCINFKRKLKS